jgi:ribonuclease Z
MTTSINRRHAKYTPEKSITIMKASKWLVGIALLLSQAASTRAQTNDYPLATRPRPDEMRITFMGTDPVPRESQACNSIFIECGTNDCFVFDCGAGVIEKYVAMGVPYSRMDKIFLTHIHADHMSDLMFIYCFGPSTDRMTPLYVWGPSGPTNDPISMVACPEEGTTNFCQLTMAAAKWHTNSFSFLSTGLTDGRCGYTIVPHELPYYDLSSNPAYSSNGVRITYFPAIHDRDGAISYRLDWKGLSMVFSGDGRPNYFMLANATNLDVLAHEVVVSPQLWATINTGGLTNGPEYDLAVSQTKYIEDCSHTPAQALGYMLHQLDLIHAAPRLAVGTHCTTDASTTNELMTDIRSWYTNDVVLAKDCLVLSVYTNRNLPIVQWNAVSNASPNAFYRTEIIYTNLAPPFYSNNLMQFSAFLTNSIIPDTLYTNPVIATPTGLTASSGTYADGVHLTWAPVYGATGYEIWWGLSGSTTATARLIATVTTNEYVDTDVTPGQASYYWVVAQNAACTCTSPFSAAAAGLRAGTPQVPEQLTASCSEGLLSISCFSVASRSYRLLYSTNLTSWTNALGVPDAPGVGRLWPLFTISIDARQTFYRVQSW